MANIKYFVHNTAGFVHIIRPAVLAFLSPLHHALLALQWRLMTKCDNHVDKKIIMGTAQGGTKIFYIKTDNNDVDHVVSKTRH